MALSGRPVGTQAARFDARPPIAASEVDLYLRAKIGFCNCASAIDDEEVDRVADFDLIGGAHARSTPAGRSACIGWTDAAAAMRSVGAAQKEIGADDRAP